MKFKKLLNEAQFHGARRFTEPRYRLCWVISLLFLLGFAMIIVSWNVQRFFSDPTYLEKIDLVTAEVEFPTVLVCPEANFSEYKISKFLEEVIYPEPMNATYIRKVIKQLSAFVSPDVAFNLEDLENIQHLLDFNSLDIENAVVRLTSSCEETLLRCRWRRKIVNCSSIFQMEMTRNGYCCVFNGRSLKREIRSNGVDKMQTHQLIYEDKQGHSNSLMVAVDNKEKLPDVDLDYKWVALKNGRYVDIPINGTPISPGEEAWFGFSIQISQVSIDASSLSTDLRKCKMAHDPLKFFPIYHKSHCLFECEMKRTAQQCRCLKLSHPTLPAMPHCRANQINCSRHATVSFALNDCNCPSTCNLQDGTTVMSTHQLISGLNTYDKFYESLDLERVSIIRVFMESQKKKMSIRRSYFNYFNLFSELGGVFNVFLGCSILTLLELLILACRAFALFLNK